MTARKDVTTSLFNKDEMRDGAAGSGTQRDPKPLRTNVNQITTQTHTLLWAELVKQHLNSFVGQLDQLGLITKMISNTV